MRKSILIIMLTVLFAPLAMNAQGLISASHPGDLQAITAQGQFNIEKFQTREAGWLGYDFGENLGATSFGLSSYTFGVMFPSSMLDDNNTLKTVEFYQYEAMTGDVIVNVYSGGDNAPGNLIGTTTVATTSETGLLEADFSASAVNFDPAQNLWIILTVEGGDGIYPLVYGELTDANEVNASWLNYAGGWYNVNDLLSNWDHNGWPIYAYVDYTSIACATPTNLEVSDITTSTATLTWGSMGEESAWQIVYGEEGFRPDDAKPIDVEKNKSYTLTGLTDDTDYEAYVRSNCGDGQYSAWSEVVSFYTPWLCDKPFDLETSDITYNSATLSWDGWQATYNVQYTPMTKTWEADFSNGIPSDWTLIDNDGDSNNWTAGDGYVYSASWISGTGAVTPDNWLVTPKIAMGGKLYITAYGMDPDYAAEKFAVYYSTRGGTTINRYTKISEDFVATGEPTIYAIDLSSYSGEAYIAIRHYNVTDMFRLVVSEMFTCTAGETVTVEDMTSPYTMEGLTEETFYTVKVQGNCSDGETDWSDVHYFTSGTGNVFQTDGNWNVASNWKNNVVPAEGEDVTINAACVIPANYIAIAGNVTIGETGSLTIKDGGQLIHTNEGVVATVEKAITPYTGNKDNYYLISSPVYDEETYTEYEVNITYPEDVTNMLANNYDLYGFDYTKDLEWINQKSADNFYLWKGDGYLYANNGQDVTLQFTGVLNPVPEEGFVGFIQGALLKYTEDEYDFANWNLVGNPYPCEVEIFTCNYGSSLTWVSDDFYRINGEEIVASSGVVAPMEGVFVISEGSSNIAVGMQPSSSEGKGRSLNLNLTQNGKLIDAARVRFGEGNGMPKIQLNPNHTKLFFTKENKDFAVVYGEAEGEMPVSFKAENNGTYTLSFSNENVEFSYMHLIDNMTGNDVDLLETPSYSFEAKTTDYASRFKLVFATGNASDDHFAYFSNGSLVINNEGNATMNVYDVTGRLVNTQRIDGSCQVSFNAASGVYMIQLVNGNDTKTQKIVVK